MKISKFGSAAIKVAGAASCGVGAMLSLLAAGGSVENGGNFYKVYLTSSAVCAGAGGVLLGQAARDVVRAFGSKGKR